MDTPFKTTRMLQFGDCDISGTAYFPAYLDILNGVNEAFWLHLGYPWHDTIREERWGTPTVHLTCDFVRPSLFGDELEFELTILKVGRSSITVRHHISCKGEKRWDSTQILVASDLDKHCSIPWPDEVREALLACVPAPAEDERRVSDENSNFHVATTPRQHESRYANFHSNAHEMISPRKHESQKADFHSKDIEPLTTQTEIVVSAQIRLPSHDLKEDLPFFQGTLGFKLDKIFPADDPAVAILSGHGLCLRLERGASDPPATLQLLCENPNDFADGNTKLTAPNGCRIEIIAASKPMVQPSTKHAFSVQRVSDGAPWVIGRAGMHYRDLIPDRLGGAIIASHIRIPEGGPVPDMVHYHTIGFQLIYCYRGWVRLVYEDQGTPFILHAGDCVIQPPEIRHRVLESSDNLEVVEIGVPAEHETTIDHEMVLPTPTYNPERIFGGQRFCHAKVADASWQSFRINGFDGRETGINDATAGVANVAVARFNGGTPASYQHNADILFSFILEGSMTLSGEDNGMHELKPGDAFVIPPAFTTRYSQCSDDLEILEVSLPGTFDTTNMGAAND